MQGTQVQSRKTPHAKPVLHKRSYHSEKEACAQKAWGPVFAATGEILTQQRSCSTAKSLKKNCVEWGEQKISRELLCPVSLI